MNAISDFFSVSPSFHLQQRMIGRVDVKTLLKFYSALQCGLMDIRPGHFQEKLEKIPRGVWAKM